MTTNAPSYVPAPYCDDPALDAAYRRGWCHGHGIACHCTPSLGDWIRPDIDYVGLGRYVTAENAREYHELVALHIARERMGDYWADEDEVARAAALEEAFHAGMEASVFADIAETDDEEYGIAPEEEEPAEDDEEGLEVAG